MLAVAVAACAAPRAPAPSRSATSPSTKAPAASAPAWSPAEAAHVEPIRAAVARLRELPWTRSTPVHVGDNEAFDRFLLAHGVEVERAVVGVYLDAAVWLRRTASVAESTETLAHELVHALEEQHGLLRPVTHADDEASVAKSALHEGIAIAVARAVVAERAGSTSPKRVIAELGATLEQLPLASLLDVEHEGSFERRFPYLVGPGFAGALYATGGARVWSAAERSPPTTLLHVLRPSLFLRGYREPESSSDAAHPRRPGWIVQAQLGRADAVQAASWMDDFRGAEHDAHGATQIAFASDAIARRIALQLPGAKRTGSQLVLGGERPWKMQSATLGPPPLPEWPSPAPVQVPLEQDPTLVFRVLGRGARSEALGLELADVKRSTRRGLARSELVFASSNALLTTLVTRLPARDPVESALTLLVQAFVASEVDALQAHDEPPIQAPAGVVYVRRIETSHEEILLALLPRCARRYALTFVAFGRELSYATLRGRLAHLEERVPDLETPLCRRARAEEQSDFTPPP